MDCERIKFAKKSLNRASKFQQDPFIVFIILWIGMNALYHDPEVGYEKQKVENYFKKRKDLVFKFLSENKKDTNSIISFINRVPQHETLRDFLKTKKRFLTLTNKGKSVQDFALFLYKIRNNMFHAVKTWDEEAEAKLLSLVNPILTKLMKKFLSNNSF